MIFQLIFELESDRNQISDNNLTDYIIILLRSSEERFRS